MVIESRPGEKYGRDVAADVVREISDAYPFVTVTVHPYDKGVWFTRVEFVPPTDDGVPVWLAANADGWFILTAGDTFRWALEFDAHSRAEQVEQLVEEIRQLADHGVIAVRTNRLLGAFSPSYVGSPGVDADIDMALGLRFAKVLERRDGWG